MYDIASDQTRPHEVVAADRSNTPPGDNVADPAPPDTTSSDKFGQVSSFMCCSSIFTFLQNELPALYAHLQDDDLASVRTSVTDILAAYKSPQDSSALGHLLFANTLSIASKLFKPVLEATIANPDYLGIQKMQLASELDRVKKQKDIDEVVHEWSCKRKAKAEKRKWNGGIVMMDGKPVYGPKMPDEDEDEDEDVPFAPTFAVGRGALEAMKRIM